jgi:hypothetical protein
MIGVSKAVTSRIGKREDWERLIAEAEGSSETVQDFCHRHGIAVHNFYQWRSRLRAEVRGRTDKQDKQDKHPLFVPVHVSAGTKMTLVDVGIGSRFMVQVGGGVKLEFPSGCTGDELRLVMEVLSC